MAFHMQRPQGAGIVGEQDPDAPALHELVAKQLGISKPSAMDMIGID